MYNEFGKFVRKLRIDRCKILKTMADKLKISTAYLSSMETGSKEIPIEIYDKLCSVYELDSEQKRELSDAISVSKKIFDIKIKDQASESKQKLAFAFARDLDKISEESAKRILEMFIEEQNGN